MRPAQLLKLCLTTAVALSSAHRSRSLRAVRASAVPRVAVCTASMAAVGARDADEDMVAFDFDDEDVDEADLFEPDGFEEDAFVPSDPFCSDEVLISSPDVPTLRITRPSNDAVLEQLMAQFRQEAMSDPTRFNQIMQARLEDAIRQRPCTWYWSLIWPSAVALCRWMALDTSANAALKGKRVLDLGSGVGVAGIGAVALGGADTVTLAEADARALAYATHNAGLNSVSDRVACEQLDWTADWPAHLRASFSAVLLSDVLYDADAADPIARCAAAALEPGGVILLADQTDRPYDSAARCSSLCAALDKHSPAVVGARWGLTASKDVSVDFEGKQHKVQIGVLSRVAPS